jgi:hypothetical protein
MAHTSLLLTHSSSSSPAGAGGCGGGCTYFGGMVNENREQHNLLSVSKNKMEDRRWEHTLYQASYPHSYECSTYATGGNWWPCDNQKSVG